MKNTLTKFLADAIISVSLNALSVTLTIQNLSDDIIIKHDATTAAKRYQDKH
jgi:hypothetical protein